MNKLIMMLIIASLPTIAAEVKKEEVKKTEVKKEEKIEETKDISNKNTSHLKVGPGLSIIDGEKFWGGGVGFDFQVSQDLPIYFGVESGFYRWSTSVGTVSANASYIPLLATTIARFDMNGSAFHPYAGFSLGVGLMRASIDTGTSVLSGNKTWFNGLVRVGADIDLSDSIALSIEPRAGILKSYFLFNPIIGLSFGF